MKKSYGVVILVSIIFVCFLASASFAQTVGDIMWEDHFEDSATDSLLLNDVGWFYYSESDGLVGQVTKQTAENQAYIQSGSFGGLVGAGLIQSNGVPFINPDDTTTATHDSLVANHWSDPNQEITFKVNLFQMSEGASFLVSTRMPQSDPEESFPDSDPTEAPGYFFLVDLGNSAIVLGKYPESAGGGQIPILDPSTWTMFNQTLFAFDLDVWYWVKYYLFQGTIKVKIWEGDPEEEPEEWTLEGTDDNPRVTGKYTTFATFNSVNTGGGDIFKLDDVVVRKVLDDAVSIDAVNDMVPASFSLANNYPNPFNPETTIEFSVNQLDQIMLDVYSITGQKVRTLVNEQMTPGNYKVKFDSKDDFGKILPSGIYFYRLQSSSQLITRKMILMK